MSIIKKAHLTEKTLRQAQDHNQYTFLVDPQANKHQIKQAIEELFDVKVLAVTTSTLKPSTARSGRTGYYQTTPRQKKAVVQLEDDQSIKYFEG